MNGAVKDLHRLSRYGTSWSYRSPLWSLVGKLGSSLGLAEQFEDVCALLHLDIRLNDTLSYNQHTYHVLSCSNFASLTRSRLLPICPAQSHNIGTLQ